MPHEHTVMTQLGPLHLVSGDPAPQRIRICYLPPNHTGPVCYLAADPAQQDNAVPFPTPFYPTPGPHLTPTPGGVTDMVLHGTTLYVRLPPHEHWTDADKARALAYGYGYPPLRTFILTHAPSGATHSLQATTSAELAQKVAALDIYLPHLFANYLMLDGSITDHPDRWMAEEIVTPA